jgi:hypothetical protein
MAVCLQHTTSEEGDFHLMSKPQYPLEQVTIIKQKELDEAEKTLKERKVVLDKENDKMSSLEKTGTL